MHSEQRTRLVFKVSIAELISDSLLAFCLALSISIISFSKELSGMHGGILTMLSGIPWTFFISGMHGTLVTTFSGMHGGVLDMSSGMHGTHGTMLSDMNGTFATMLSDMNCAFLSALSGKHFTIVILGR